MSVRASITPIYGESPKMSKKQSEVIHNKLSETDLGLLMVHAADIFSKTDEDAFSRVLLGTYCDPGAAAEGHDRHDGRADGA